MTEDVRGRELAALVTGDPGMTDVRPCVESSDQKVQ